MNLSFSVPSAPAKCQDQFLFSIVASNKQNSVNKIKPQ